MLNSHRLLCLLPPALALAMLWTCSCSAEEANQEFRVELCGEEYPAPTSIREHSIAWHPGKRKYYLVADVIPLSSPHHPNTYESELYLWSSIDLREWDLLGLAVPKGIPGETYGGHGVASPAGMVFRDGRLYVPFSARKTESFAERSIGLAWSGPDPEVIPWSKTSQPISDLAGEDDDPAVLMIPGDQRLHLYHRTTGKGGYRIVHTSSSTPLEPSSWEPAGDVTKRPNGVDAQELTGAIHWMGTTHLFVIEKGSSLLGGG